MIVLRHIETNETMVLWQNFALYISGCRIVEEILHTALTPYLVSTC